MRLMLACLLAISAGPAVAQGWKASTSDDGVWFQAWAVAPGAATLDVFCGGPSPTGRPVTPEHFESGRTDPGTLRLALGFRALGFSPSSDFEAPPRKVGLAIDGKAYRIRFSPNGMDDTYEARLSARDPLFAALAGGAQVSVQVGGRTTYKAPLKGAGKAISQAVAFCARKQG